MSARSESAGAVRSTVASGGGIEPSGPVHRLFFAAFPADRVRQAMADCAARLRERQPGLRGRWVDPQRYHLTLHYLGEEHRLRADWVERACAAAAKLRTPPVAVVFDHVASFTGRWPPCVLRCPEGTEPVRALWLALGRQLLAAGFHGGREPEFAPHVTLLYADGEPVQRENVTPIAWTIDEVALVHSIAGHKDYRILARWPLAAA